jgi:DNA modification methylase
MIINMDCRTGMAGMPDNSVDAIVCDPPYGLSKQPDMREVLKHWLNGDEYSSSSSGFMGKKWDSFVPGPLVWEQAFRVLKPGGYLVAFAGSRTVDLMSMSLRLGGFEITDMLHWMYGVGFPKSMDIGKAIDRQRYERDDILEVTKWVAETRDAAGITNKAIDDAFGTHGMAGHWTSSKSQPSVPTVDQVAELLVVLGSPEVPPRIRQLLMDLNGRKGEPGPNWGKREVTGKHKNPNQANAWDTNYTGSKLTEASNITEPHSEAAKKWEGWGTALKPCHEPIVLCRKPLDGTYANNVQKHGVGALNIDACRVSDEKRWPGNVLHDGCLPEPMDRYFYSAKATKKDREAGLALFELASAKECTGGREDGSAGLDSPRAGAGRTEGSRNFHPTVKPTAVMRWLCRLITPPGGLILDPFTGSGSTGRGAVLEGFQFIGFELDPDYVALANARVLDAENERRDTANN